MRFSSALLLFASACAPAISTPRPAPAPSSEYLYLWTSSADSTEPDFLAVYDIRPREGAAQYGTLVTTLPVPGGRNYTHHTEHAMAPDRRLFANAFGSGASFIFDLTEPAAPKLAGEFGMVGPLMHPHSYLRMPSGNVLATFQMQHDASGNALPGGLAELTPSGEVVRSASAALPGVDPRVRPYSAAVVPAHDLAVVTTSDMNPPDSVDTIQLWRLSDLTLQQTVRLPPGPVGNEGYLSAEPRLLNDGRTVLVSTFNCGLYLLDGLDTPRTSARLVASFPQKDGTNCAIPVIAGHYYLVTVPALSAVVSLDISDPAHPREVSRLVVGGADDVPHWIGLEPNQQRVVITGYRGLQNRVLMARFDAATGQLSMDDRFRAAGSAEPGLRLSGVTWPHGAKGAGKPHGAVFGRK